MRVTAIMLLTLIIQAAAIGKADEIFGMNPVTDCHHMTRGDKIHFYRKSSIDPVSILTGAFSSGFSQAIDSDPEWGQGMEGYGKRFASSMGRKSIERTARLGMKILLREDPRYFYSNRHGIRRRTLHAISEIFVAHKDFGGTRPNYSYFVGMVSGVYISRQWHPENSRRKNDYIQDAAISIVIQSAKNVFTEFWPDIRKKILKR